MTKVNQPTSAPTHKVASAGITGASVVLLVYLAGLFEIDLPPEVASAVTVVMSFAAAYFTKNERL